MNAAVINSFAVRPVKSPVTALALSPRTYHCHVSWAPGEDQNVVSATERPPWEPWVAQHETDTMPCAKRDELAYNVGSHARRRQLEEIYAAEQLLERIIKERAKRAQCVARKSVKKMMTEATRPDYTVVGVRNR